MARRNKWPGIGGLLAAVALFAGHQAWANDAAMEQQARGVNQGTRHATGDAGKINESFVKPLLGGSQMQTFNQQTAFDAKLMCKGQNKFAEILIAPRGNGEISIMSIRQDLDMDGQLDSYSTPGWTATAICSNGFLQCSDPADSTTCQSYAWATGNNYVLGRQRVALSDMGGCYCISGACGANLAWNNLGTVLKDLGGGAAGALAKANPYFTLTESQVSEVSIALYGVDSKQCNTSNPESTVGSGGLNLTSIYNNPNSLENKGAAQSGSSPLFNTVKQSALAQDTKFQMNSCTVTRDVPLDEVTLNDIIAFDGGVGGLYPNGSSLLDVVLGRVGDNYWHGGSGKYFSVSTNFFVKRPDRIKKARLIRAIFDDWIQVKVRDKYIWSGPYNNWNYNGPVPGPTELNTSWNQTPNVDFTSILTKEAGPVEFYTRVLVGGDGEGYSYAQIEVDSSCKLEADVIKNSCRQYEIDNKCILVEEKVDGVVTFSNNIGTGLSPMTQYRHIAGNTCSFDIQRPWFNKQRIYRCETGDKYDFNRALERVAYVQKNSTPKRYYDRYFDEVTGRYKTGEGDLFFKNYGVGSCVNVCKTRKPVPMAQMTGDGYQGKGNKQNMQYDMFYHECGSDNACPAGEGEEVIKACQCMNEFAEAAAIMQTLRLGGMDTICSTGVRRYPDE